jgi:hypothetical protein
MIKEAIDYNRSGMLDPEIKQKEISSEIYV